MLLKKRFMFFAALALLVFVGQASAGPNANATVSLDLIADGGAGNQKDDGVTSGTVSGQGTKIAVEVFAKGVTTSLIGMKIEFNFDASVLQFSKAENSAFAFILPEPPTATNLAAVAPVTLPASGFLARAEFTTTVDVTGREFSIGIRRVTFAESASSSDVITTTDVITFNAAPSPDFDGDGEVGIPDFLMFVDVFGSSQGDGKYEAKYDLDGNGVIEIPDFLIFVDNFGKKITSSGDEIVDIPDANLRTVIEEHLGKASGEAITSAEMSALTHLYARNKGIRDLTGLEFATNLQTLNLGDEWVSGGPVNSNSILDFSPLSGLTSLTSLDLASSDISNLSALVSAISSLTKLTYLNLSYTSISDISALSALTNLTSLVLSYNSISDISALSNLTSLTTLVLWDNNISDISSLSSLTSLTTLYLNSNSISDIAVLSGLTNLTYLGLSSNNISDISELSNLTNLTSLNLEGNSISDISALSNLTNLKSLSLGHNSISDISALSNLTSLTWLSLRSSSISDISVLSGLTNLTYLHLGHNNISDISTLSSLTSLEKLYLNGNSISDISALSNLTNLKSLSLAFNNSISNISALSNLTNLTYLNFGRNNISDISTMSNLTSLEVLHLFANSISDISTMSNLTSLRRLYLNDNSISDLAPLVSNTGLSGGDYVDVRNNPLSEISINTHIPALQDRGVTVQFGSSKPAVGETERRMPHEVMKRFGREEWEKEGDLFGQ